MKVSSLQFIRMFSIVFLFFIELSVGTKKESLVSLAGAKSVAIWICIALSCIVVIVLIVKIKTSHSGTQTGYVQLNNEEKVVFLNEEKGILA